MTVDAKVEREALRHTPATCISSTSTLIERRYMHLIDLYAQSAATMLRFFGVAKAVGIKAPCGHAKGDFSDSLDPGAGAGGDRGLSRLAVR